VGFTFLKLEYTDVLTRLNWSESNDLEFKPDFVKDDKVESKIFDTLTAMSNTEGGNIVIGVSEPQNSPREIKGTNRSETEIGDRLSHMIREYVDPPTLVTDVYSIQSLDKPKLIGIESHHEAGRYFSKRFHGRSTTKPTTYTFLLRVNGDTVIVDFSTFISIVQGKGLVSFLGKETEPPELPLSIRGYESSYEDFNRRLGYYEKLAGTRTKEKVFQQIKSSVISLPVNSVQNDDLFKKIVQRILDIYQKENKVQETRDRWLSVIETISQKCDSDTLSIINKIIYKDLSQLFSQNKSETIEIIMLIQRLNAYNESFMLQLVDCAVNHWTDQEFELLKDRIDLHSVNIGTSTFLSKLCEYLITNLDAADSDIKKYNRLEYFYDKYC
jgi:hypothetical protein